MATNNQQTEAAPPSNAERIVSVNEIGGSASGLSRKLLLLIPILAVATVGTLMAANRWREHAHASEAAQAQQASAASGPARPTSRRVFKPAPATEGNSSATAGAPPAPMVGLICSDGQPGAPLLDKQGTPVRAPAGQPVRICPNGQLLLPPLPDATAVSDPAHPAPSNPPAPAVAAPPATPSAAAAAPTGTARRDDGDLYVPQQRAPDPQPAAAIAAGLAQEETRPAADAAPSPRGNLHAMLHAQPNQAVQASRMSDRDMVLPAGRSIDCNLSLRVVSDISGLAVCVLSSYVYGDSGVVALAEPGSIATGDYVAINSQGQRRLFILWSRLKTTQGVLIQLNSPATDALGTSGLDGYVDNHWSERIGAAVLLSWVQDATAYATARASSANGNGAAGIALFPQSTQTGEHLAERILDSTINIKPTIYKQQGDRASITVARDLDFGSVYVLRTK